MYTNRHQHSAPLFAAKSLSAKESNGMMGQYSQLP